MTRFQSHVRIARVGLFAVLSAGFCLVGARAQSAEDCSKPVPLWGPLTCEQALCAVDHANSLYSQHCDNNGNCDDHTKQVTQAFRMALEDFGRFTRSPNFRQYLITRANPDREDQTSPVASCRPHPWEHFQLVQASLEENSHRYYEALNDYLQCSKPAGGNGVPDPADQQLCADSVVQLSCMMDPSQAICSQPAHSRPEEVAFNTETVTDTASTNSALSSDGDSESAPDTPPQVKKESRIVTVDPPSAQVLRKMRNQMTPEDRKSLQYAIDHLKLTITPQR